MEDRHSFSDPRPVQGFEFPTWEVDVFCEGVQEPVFTLLVDKTTLPPRRRKKKVVWKLPDSCDTLPSFGSDEKRRLLDLFKQQKKTRRKSKKASAGTDKDEAAKERESEEDKQKESVVAKENQGASTQDTMTNGLPEEKEAEPVRDQLPHVLVTTEDRAGNAHDAMTNVQPDENDYAQPGSGEPVATPPGFTSSKPPGFSSSGGPPRGLSPTKEPPGLSSSAQSPGLALAMEGRHSFSDPRPVYGCELPTWEVDVFREGVQEPVFTLLVDKTTLPPRMRKRKVIWTLPGSYNTLPSFGSDEKRRLLDLFKQQKKTRRRKSKKASAGTAMDEAVEEKKKEPEDKQKECVVTKEDQAAGTHDTPMANGLPEENEEEPVGDQMPQVLVTTEQVLMTTEDRVANAHDAMTNVQPDENDYARNGDGEPVATPPGFPSSKPPGFASSSGPPPGLASSSEPPSLSSSSAQPADLSTTSAQPPGLSSSDQPPGFSSLSLNDPEPEQSSVAPDTPRRFFVVSPGSTNVPVDLAKSVVDIYYPCISQGHSRALLQHYAPQAQKSLSVGGAHAVCGSVEECLLQLCSLQSSHFLVRGVVAQQGFQESVVLQITGSVQNDATRSMLPFCHTVVLIRINEQGYQIHNDAMVLLTE